MNSINRFFYIFFIIILSLLCVGSTSHVSGVQASEPVRYSGVVFWSLLGAESSPHMMSKRRTMTVEGDSIRTTYL